jgi:hypothetical protein
LPFTKSEMAAGSEIRATADGQKIEIASPVNMCGGPSGMPPTSSDLGGDVRGVLTRVGQHRADRLARRRYRGLRWRVRHSTAR